VQGVREENRSDQRSLLQVLQGHHSRGLRARGKNTKFQFFGTHQRPAHTRPQAGFDHVHSQTAGGEYLPTHTYNILVEGWAHHVSCMVKDDNLLYRFFTV